jgi:hypothetical protein
MEPLLRGHPGKRARRKNLRHPRERFLVSNEAPSSWRPLEIFSAGVWDLSTRTIANCTKVNSCTNVNSYQHCNYIERIPLCYYNNRQYINIKCMRHATSPTFMLRTFEILMFFSLKYWIYIQSTRVHDSMFTVLVSEFIKEALHFLIFGMI